VSLEVASGELVAVLGPSGCGKTTLLRLIAGFERPDAGSLSVGGVEMAGTGSFVPPDKRKIGMVFQDYALFPHLTVKANVAFGLARRAGDERDALAQSTLELVGLQHRAGRYPHELSGGERQRIALARALAPEPDVVLLDEPFSNLDASLRAGLRREVELGLTRTGFADRFETIITADDISQCKPDPAGYLAARAALEQRKPLASCVAIEDSLPGLAAARAAGMACVMLTTSHSTRTLRDSGATLVWDSFVGHSPAELADL